MLSVALAGQPNTGKTTLFNSLTGARQKVGNYPGVTVERKEGWARDTKGRELRILDLPGTYSLDAQTPDEIITRDVLLGREKGERRPDILLALADATQLERSLALVLELKALGIPMVLALNMIDLARARGLEIDLPALARELGVPVVATVATHALETAALLAAIEEIAPRVGETTPDTANAPRPAPSTTPEAIRDRFQEIDRILAAVVRRPVLPSRWTDRIDAWVLHPIWGGVILLAVLTFLFQSIFTWAALPQDAIKGGIEILGQTLSRVLGEGPLTSLLVDGIIAGVGSVLVFLPQILILFLFILILEDSGYMARAAFLMDQWMGRVGLHGRAFIPLLSSYACAIPGIMATRTIENPRDRLTTILVAPLTTCSARLPVYALLVGAFVPDRAVLGPLTLQGLTLLGLYLLGIFSALGMAFIFRRTLLKGPKPALLLELPTYKWPSARGLALGIWERSKGFIVRAGTVILSLSVLLWFLASYPKPPEGALVDADHPAILYSAAGRLGTALEPLVKPLGFNWRIAVALIPGFAAREVMVGALATVYAVEATGDDDGLRTTLGNTLSQHWSVATALSLLVWYVFACQCLSTLAVTRRETQSLRWPAFMLLYMTALAYLAAFATYRLAVAAGLGPAL